MFKGPPQGIGVLTAGFVLAIMVIPFISAVMRDVFDVVPPVLKESAYGIGCTTWEVVRHVVLPYTKIGVIGGIMLGLGRALGETMAVTFLIGNAHRLTPSILAPGNSIASALANEFTEAVGDLYTSALDRARPHTVRHYIHRARVGQAAVAPARQARRQTHLRVTPNMASRYTRRLIVNRFNLTMSLLTMMFGLSFLLWILWTLFSAGFAALSAGSVHSDDASTGKRGRACSTPSWAAF